MTLKRTAIFCASALAAGLFLATGCVERRVVYVHEPGPGPAPGPDAAVVTDVPPPGEVPPAPQVEVIGVAPGPDYVWVGGAWAWHGRWVWAPGRWAIGPHPHAIWVGGHWIHRRHGWVWVRGYWR